MGVGLSRRDPGWGGCRPRDRAALAGLGRAADQGGRRSGHDRGDRCGDPGAPAPSRLPRARDLRPRRGGRAGRAAAGAAGRRPGHLGAVTARYADGCAAWRGDPVRSGSRRPRRRRVRGPAGRGDRAGRRRGRRAEQEGVGRPLRRRAARRRPRRRGRPAPARPGGAAAAGRRPALDRPALHRRRRSPPDRHRARDAARVGRRADRGAPTRPYCARWSAPARGCCWSIRPRSTWRTASARSCAPTTATAPPESSENPAKDHHKR